ncbi:MULTISPECIES: hypothetical protein [unclassified Streptomyces]|uniref:hypothetical protein n=1 Tax=unclassified Streptomyces TaxID=2593676 RepID=UPI002E2A9A19|nr:hypothetical protein [Streptomyces sp. NBC_01429]
MPREVRELALVHSRLPVSGEPGERPSYETIARCRLGRAARGHPGDGAATCGR